MSLTKNQKKLASYDFSQACEVEKAVEILKKYNYVKFDPSVDFHVMLEINIKNTAQVPRGAALPPHGTGKNPRVLALCSADKVSECLAAGADYAGSEEYLEKISQGWVDIDAIVAMPSLMPKLGKLGKLLGPKGLMPSPTTGTVTMDLVKAIKELKAGKINIRPDKYGIVHGSLGRLSFSPEQIKENLQEVIATLLRLKPPAAKGNYIKSVTLASTMGKGIPLIKSSLLTKNND